MHTRRLGRLAARAFLAGALVAGIAACGDDDDDDAAVDAPAGEGEQAAGGGEDGSPHFTEGMVADFTVQ